MNQQIAEREGLSVRAFEKSIGASDGVISKALRTGSDISSKWILAITEYFPQYSPRWLLTGEGSMLVADAGQEEGPRAGSVFIPSEVVQMFGDMAATIRSQQEELAAIRRRHLDFENHFIIKKDQDELTEVFWK